MRSLWGSYWRACVVAPICIALFVPWVSGQGVSLEPGEITLAKRTYPPPPTFSANTNSVDLAVVVRGRDGKPVSDLSAADFLLLDRGQPQAIASFSVERNPGAAGTGNPVAHSGLPVASAAPAKRFIGVFVDDLHTDNAGLRYAANALKGYLQTADRTTRYTVIASSGRPIANLDKLSPATHAFGGGCPLITPEQAYLILNGLDSDALQLATSQANICSCVAIRQHASRAGGASGAGCVDATAIKHKADMVWSQERIESERTLSQLSGLISAMAQEPGERVLLLVSNGFLTHDLNAELDRTVTAALRAGIVVNALDSRGLTAATSEDNRDDPPLIQDPRLSAYRDTLATQQAQAQLDGMAALAEETGGRVFTNNNDLESGVNLLLSPEVVYHLSFAPQDVASDGSFHPLLVRLDRPGLSLQTRTGYYAPPAPSMEQAAALRRQAELEDAVREPTANSRIPLQVGWTPNGTPGLSVTVQIGTGDLPYARKDGRNLEQLTLVSVLLDANERIVASDEVVLTLRLRDATRKVLPTANLSLTLQAPAGTYTLREVLQEAEQGRIGALTQTVVIPKTFIVDRSPSQTVDRAGVEAGDLGTNLVGHG